MLVYGVLVGWKYCILGEGCKTSHLDILTLSFVLESKGRNTKINTAIKGWYSLFLKTDLFVVPDVEPSYPSLLSTHNCHAMLINTFEFRPQLHQLAELNPGPLNTLTDAPHYLIMFGFYYIY